MQKEGLANLGESFDEVAKRYNEERKTSMQKARLEVKRALENLRADGIEKVILDYDGHNDEGFIKKATFVTTDGKATEKNQMEIGEVVPHSPLGVIIDYMFRVFEGEGAYEHNEGSFGTCSINTETGKYGMKVITGYGKPYDSW